MSKNKKEINKYSKKAERLGKFHAENDMIMDINCMKLLTLILRDITEFSDVHGLEEAIEHMQDRAKNILISYTESYEENTKSNILHF